jgi:hypothetical protein
MDRKGKRFLFLLSGILACGLALHLFFTFSIFFERFHRFVKKQAHLFRLPVQCLDIPLVPGVLSGKLDLGIFLKKIGR